MQASVAYIGCNSYNLEECLGLATLDAGPTSKLTEDWFLLPRTIVVKALNKEQITMGKATDRQMASQAPQGEGSLHWTAA